MLFRHSQTVLLPSRKTDFTIQSLYGYRGVVKIENGWLDADGYCEEMPEGATLPAGMNNTPP